MGYSVMAQKVTDFALLSPASQERPHKLALPCRLNILVRATFCPLPICRSFRQRHPVGDSLSSAKLSVSGCILLPPFFAMVVSSNRYQFCRITISIDRRNSDQYRLIPTGQPVLDTDPPRTLPLLPLSTYLAVTVPAIIGIVQARADRVVHSCAESADNITVSVFVPHLAVFSKVIHFLTLPFSQSFRLSRKYRFFSSYRSSKGRISPQAAFRARSTFSLV